MRDITAKTETMRTALACGKVVCTATTLQLIMDQALPKGNLFDVARAAAMLAAKNTAHLIPYCHSVSMDALDIHFQCIRHDPPEEHVGMITLHAEAKSIGRTGIEMEALTAVSVAALVIYDLLKPVDNHLEISGIRLLDKKGGKSDRPYFKLPPVCAVLVCSDSIAAGARQDNAGQLIVELLEKAGANVVDYQILPEEPAVIQRQIRQWVYNDIAFIFTCGGTGLGPRDHTVEAVRAMLERDVDGITEAMRHYGQQGTPVATMASAVAGFIGHTTVVTLPGSSRGAMESLQAILPAIFHARKILKGGGH